MKKIFFFLHEKLLFSLFYVVLYSFLAVVFPKRGDFFLLNSISFFCVVFCCIIVVLLCVLYFDMHRNLVAFVALLLFACIVHAQGDAAPLVVAHRGGAAEGSENTLSCIENAILVGADAVEIDVRLTADGYLVACHDATVDATTNGRGRVSELTLEQVQALRVVDKNGAVTAECIPTLRQVLECVGGRCMVLIDVKRSGRDIEQQLMGDIAACGAQGWVSVQAFSDAVLRNLRELGAPFPLEKLVVFKVPFLPFIYDGSLRFFSFKKYDYISSFNFHKRCLSRSLAAKIRARGKGVKVWAVGSPADAPGVVVDAVITDYPSLWKCGETVE